jgi:hypothetical protein
MGDYCMKKFCLAMLLMFICSLPCLAEDMEVTPFRTVNQSPLVQIFGMPSDTSSTVVKSGRTRVSLTQDIASNYTVASNSSERIHLDGESYRWILAARYGLTDRLEVGMDVPYLLSGGGFMDGFIVDWHKTFGLPQGGRDSAPKNKLQYSYNQNGRQVLNMDRSGSGIGDISLAGALKLYDVKDGESHDSISLRAALKLPSGDSAQLRGSGSTDFSVYLCGSMNNFTEWGSLGLFGSIGGMAMTKGDVLRDQQKNLAGFGTTGLGWGPAEWISFKFQLNAHTALYRSSSFAELSKSSLMLTVGGSLKLPGSYLLDIGVSEDLAVATAPDVAFHIGLSRQF